MDVTDNRRDWLAQQFEGHRTHLRAVALRMLGSPTEADDAVQEAWLRLSRSTTSEIDNLGGWLTTVVGRVCLDMLRSRKSRREEPIADDSHEHLPDTAPDPEHEAVMADSVGLALLVVLETLAPDERLAFVLHDLFGVSFEEIAPIVGRNEAAARQLASRARRRVRGASPNTEVPDPERQREIVEAFLAASREGDLNRLLGLLDPAVVMRADATVVRRPHADLTEEVRGAEAVAGAFVGRAYGVLIALIDGVPGGVWLSPGGRPLSAFAFTVRNDKIVGIDLLGDPERMRQLDIVVLNG
ncbi:MAG: sigma-70 family RNA polymerase sigma factor [Chloroflexi bacterium]|nr:sigma-70 family RNA polymerase sigma factor [Chloroflexota bacterium]MBV9895233.1 sigma-70 family RNA polymerase sigma factor [Chloroflexota bacterium]